LRPAQPAARTAPLPRLAREPRERSPRRSTQRCEATGGLNMLTDSVPHKHVAIIGTGFGAIATAVRLQRAGFDDLVLIDRAGDVGGVWRDNSYPGAAVDVKSHLYSLSFAPTPDWHNVFAKQAELHAFLRRVTDQFDL